MEALADLIIRPPRRKYNEEMLPDSLLMSNGDVVKRIRVEIQNSKNEKIIGSLYKPEFQAPGNPCMIYLHGNASSQEEGQFLISLLCPHGICVFCFDCTGSGISEGKYIGLGYTEKEDLNSVVSYLKRSQDIVNIALWGRSMGATTALWYATEHTGICGIIVDSPYQSVKAIARDLTWTNWFAWLIVCLLFRFVSNAVLKHAGFSAYDIDCTTNLKNAKCTALFVHAVDDDFIGIRQSREMFKHYGGKQKYMLTPPGKHNSNRPKDVLLSELLFVFNIFDLVIDEEEIILSTTIDDHSSAHFSSASQMISDNK